MAAKAHNGPTYQEAWQEVERLSQRVGRQPLIRIYPPRKSKLGTQMGALLYLTIDNSVSGDWPDGTYGSSKSFGYLGEYETISSALWNAAVDIQNKLEHYRRVAEAQATLF